MTAIILTKPKLFDTIDTSAVEEMVRADQHILPTLKLLVEYGESKIKEKTGFSDESPPPKSPIDTPELSLDGIAFRLRTHVQTKNPIYQQAFDRTLGFLEVLINDFNAGIRKDRVRTYDVRDGSAKEPFVEFHYLMRNVLGYLSRATEHEVVNSFEGIEPPPDLDVMPLETLEIPLEVLTDFDIDRQGVAKVWYLARRFYEEVKAETVAPVEEEMARRSGVTKEDLPPETQHHREQFGNLVYKLTNVPSIRRQPGRAIKRIFVIPKRDDLRESNGYPVIIEPDNYHQLLEEYSPLLDTSLKRWRSLDGKIGEIVIFYYGAENDQRVKEEFPDLPRYKVRKDNGKMFLSIHTIYNRMMELSEEYKTGRLLRLPTIEALV